MKLSKAQADVLKHLDEGWDLCVSSTFDGGVWLQNGGCGKGGKTEKVNTKTFISLYNRGLIRKVKQGFPTSVYARKVLMKERIVKLWFRFLLLMVCILYPPLVHVIKNIRTLSYETTADVCG
jgi:hypothetical protein